MSTTNLFVELLVIGIGCAGWLILLTVAALGYDSTLVRNEAWTRSPFDFRNRGLGTQKLPMFCGIIVSFLPHPQIEKVSAGDKGSHGASPLLRG